MKAHFGMPIAPSVVVFDAAAGGIRITDRVTGTKYRQYLSGGNILWEAAATEDNLDISFVATRGPVYEDRSTGTLYRKYISSGNVLKEVVANAEPEDFLFLSGKENVMTDRSTGAVRREYISSTIENLEAVS